MKKRFGRLDAAFNNAGVLGPLKPITELTVNDYDAVMGLNLRAVWLLMKHEVTAMMDSGAGSIVNTSSFVARASTPGTSVYSASKAVLLQTLQRVVLSDWWQQCQAATWKRPATKTACARMSRPPML